ncbi:MAG: DNA polymerase III subunit delta [Rubrobacter sp.]|nr:DNA polymerase III subunit delta [Rubrobacter sp.]
MGIYLLLGDDEERKSRGVEKLRRERQADAYDAYESSPEEVVSACNSYSLFGDGAFVVVRNLDAWNAAQKAKIVDYLANPSPETDLVLLGKKLGSRERLFTAVKKVGEVHNLEQPTGKALVRWAIGHAKKLDLDLPEDVAQNLADRCSGDKTRIAREIEKLSLYVTDRPAAEEDVAALSPPDVQGNIFAFVDALAAGERGKAIKLLEDLLATGEPPLRATFMIRRQFQLLARARAMFAEGAGRSQVASELKIPPFVARKLEEQGRRISEEDAERALEYVLYLESGLKGGSDLGDELQMELAVMKLST